MLRDELTLEIDPEHTRVFGPCDCCGNMTKRVWDYVHRGDAGFAAYFVEWTPNHRDCAANFDFIYGVWGEGTTAEDRIAISVAYRYLDSGPSFMVIDASSRPVSQSTLVKSAATRNEVLGGNLREITFALCDVVYLNDPRIEEIRNGPPVEPPA